MLYGHSVTKLATTTTSTIAAIIAQISRAKVRPARSRQRCGTICSGCERSVIVAWCRRMIHFSAITASAAGTSSMTPITAPIWKLPCPDTWL